MHPKIKKNKLFLITSNVANLWTIYQLDINTLLKHELLIDHFYILLSTFREFRPFRIAYANIASNNKVYHSKAFQRKFFIKKLIVG